MGTEDKTEYRLDQIDEKLSAIDEKFESLNEKLDDLKTDILTNRCSQPNLCIILKTQMDGVTATLERVNKRLDDHDAKTKIIESDLQGVKTWQRVAIWGFGVLGSIGVFFQQQIISFFKMIF